VLRKFFYTDISITSHGGFITAALEELSRPIYALPTGGVSNFVDVHSVDVLTENPPGVLPVVVKGTMRSVST
jgi:hypothetical protein